MLVLTSYPACAIFEKLSGFLYGRELQSVPTHILRESFSERNRMSPVTSTVLSIVSARTHFVPAAWASKLRQTGRKLAGAGLYRSEVL